MAVKPFGFGVLRVVLAMCVVTAYLGPAHFYLLVQATPVLILLSGYVTSYMLDSRYMSAAGGMADFAMQRLLRVLPVYVVMFPICVWVAVLCPDISSGINAAYWYVEPLGSGENFMIWVKNLLIVPLANPWGVLTRPVFVSPFWAVGTEMVLWALAPLMLAHARFRQGMGLAGAVFVAYVIGLWEEGEERHPWNLILCYSMTSAVLPFVLGMSIYLWKQRGAWRMPYAAVLALLAAYVGFLCFEYGAGVDIIGVGWVVSVGFGAALVYGAAGLDGTRMPRWLRIVDAALGAISFPMMVVAVPVATLVCYVRPDFYLYNHSDHLKADWTIFLQALPYVGIAAAALFFAVERPAARLRRWLRAKRQPSAMTPT